MKRGTFAPEVFETTAIETRSAGKPVVVWRHVLRTCEMTNDVEVIGSATTTTRTRRTQPYGFGILPTAWFARGGYRVDA